MKKILSNDTIVAISSPPGASLRGIVRMSGPQTFEHLAPVFTSDKGDLPTSFSAGEGHLQLKSLPPIPATVFVMPSPHSYTTEDMVEIHTVGSHLLLETILEHFLRCDGISLAAPGEFTKRAFLHGRIDLLQAEGVLQMIEASSARELEQAQQLLTGEVGSQIHEAADLLKLTLAEAQAYIDFPEYDVEPDDLTNYQRQLAQVRDLLTQVRARSSRRRQTGQATHIALVGTANVGKSTLFNALIERDKAIVSDVPGTTRDGVTEEISHRGLDFILHDLAPWDLEGEENKLAVLAGERSEEIAGQVDLCALVLDGTRALSPLEKKRLETAAGRDNWLIIANKSDAPLHRDFDEIADRVEVSARDGRGFDDFWPAVMDVIHRREGQGENLFSQRQLEIFREAQDAVDRALELPCEAVDLLALEVEDSLRALSELVGEVVNEEILDIVFSRFCIGK